MRFPFFNRQTEIKEHASPAPATPDKSEISRRDPLLYPSGTWTPYNPDLLVQRKGGLDIYEKMRTDEQIKACMYIKKLAIMCTGWTVQAVSDDNADIEVADFCTNALENIKGTLEDKIKQILTALEYGFSVSEKIWGLIEQGDFAGKIGLLNIKTRQPKSWDFDTDEFGNLRPRGLWQMNGRWKYEPIKFVVYSHNGEFDNFYGNSDLRAAYRPWWSKDNIIKFYNMFLEKFGTGIPYLHPAQGKETIADPAFTNLKNLINNIQNGTAISQQSADATIDIIESTRRSQGEYDRAISLYDRAIARALLWPTGLGMSEDTTQLGSQARSQTHFDMWLMVIMDLRKEVEESVFNEQIIPELVNYNYNVNKYPKFKFNSFEGDDISALGKLWIEAINGKAVHPDPEDENHFRRMVKFPERDIDELEMEIEEGKQKAIDISGSQGIQEDEPIPEEILHSMTRELTKFEKRVSFARIDKDLAAIDKDAGERLKGILERQRDKLINSLEKAWDRIDMKWVTTLSLSYGVEFQAVIKEFMRTAFEAGRQDALGEIDKAKGKKYHKYIVKIPPSKTIEMLQKNSFWIKNVTFDSLTKRIQALLINALETGELTNETLMKVKAAYEPFIGDEQKLKDAKQAEPYRIETMIRTNTTKAYNRGKMAEFQDPEIDGFVRAVQLSAIIDTRTTDTCREADGKIVMLDDPLASRLLPPLHFNCRTIAVPITEVDGEFEPSKQSELNNVLTSVPAEFGGNID